MNRRKLFGILPLSLLGLATSAKSQTAKIDGFIDPYIEHVCEIVLNPDGYRKLYPSKPWVSIFLRGEEKELAEKKSEEGFAKRLKEYNETPRCGQRFRHLRGALATCPKCGHGSQSLDNTGTPC